MSIRILHVLDHSLPLHSGYAFRTLAILREQEKRNWQTLQVTTPRHGVSDADRETIEGFTFLRTSVPKKSAGLFAEMRATARRVDEAVKEFQPDVIHAHSPVLAGLPALWIARRRKRPLVYEVRALWEDAAVDHGSSSAKGLRYRASRALESYVLRRADHVTTICDGLRQEIVGRGVPPESVTVIPNAVDVGRFAIDAGRVDVASPPRQPCDRLQIGFIGSFYHYEGLDLLLEAIAQLRQEGICVEAWLVGGGPEDEALRQQADALGITDSVHFTGRVDNDGVAAYYQQLDALIYPRRSSRLTEMVTPLKPLEAMANGKLVLASDIGGHRELVQHERTGLLFQPNRVDTLSTLIKEVERDRDQWPAIVENGFDFVRNERNWTASVARYESVYRQGS